MPGIEVVELDQSKAFMLPYAPAIRVPQSCGYLFLSGAVASDDEEYPVDIVQQVRRVMARHTQALEANGLGWNDVIHVFEFLTDMRDTVPVHVTMAEFFTDPTWKPANTLIGVNALARAGARFELDIIAGRPSQGETSGEAFWMSGATAIPLYHMHPHVDEECILPDDISEQTRRVLTTFDEILEFTGGNWGDVRKATVFLTDLRDLETVRAALTAHLGGASPAISLVGINALSAPGARLELEVTTVPAATIRGGRPRAGEHPEGSRPSVLAPQDAPLIFLPAISILAEGDSPPSDIAAQTGLVLDGVADHLNRAQLDWSSVVKVLVHLVDARDAGEVEGALRARCGDWMPAITIIQVDNLPVAGARVQLEVVAAG